MTTRPDPDAAEIEAAILDLLAARAPGRSICPSEAARRLDPTAWRALMAAVRATARRMRDEGRLEITQKGVAVDPAAARGPIRLRLPSGR